MIWAASLVHVYVSLASLTQAKSPSPLNAYDAPTHLSLSDISADVPSEPTDPFRQGANIYLGATNNTLCSVRALLNFLAIRGQADGLLFHFQDLTPLTKQRFTSLFRSLLQRAGFDSSQYSGHSKLRHKIPSLWSPVGNVFCN